jgi:hypothetical protein
VASEAEHAELRASAERNPNATRVMSRILVLTDFDQCVPTPARNGIAPAHISTN